MELTQIIRIVAAVLAVIILGILVMRMRSRKSKS
jgi:hypothetical protein